MRKKEKCCICARDISSIEKIIKVKEKMLYEDKDGIWYNFKTSYICSLCLNEIKNKVKAKV